MHIARYDDDRNLLLPFLALADSSPAQIATYISRGEALVPWDGSQVLGPLQILRTGDATMLELKSMEVMEARRREGIGQSLVKAAVGFCCAANANRSIVSTAIADIVAATILLPLHRSVNGEHGRRFVMRPAPES
jgi:GNAT superfamily N-acetyltransferase